MKNVTLTTVISVIGNITRVVPGKTEMRSVTVVDDEDDVENDEDDLVCC
jgi:hypothetical protein